MTLNEFTVAKLTNDNKNNSVEDQRDLIKELKELNTLRGV